MTSYSLLSPLFLLVWGGVGFIYYLYFNFNTICMQGHVCYVKECIHHAMYASYVLCSIDS